MRIDAYHATITVAAALVISLSILDYFGFYAEPLSQAADVVTAGAAVWFAALELEQYGVEETLPHRESWILFSAGIGCRLTSEVIYQIYGAYGNVAPIPSVGNTFSLAGYAMIVLGMLLYVRHYTKALTRTKLAAIGVIVASAALVGFFSLLSPQGVAVLSAPGVETLAVLYTITHFLGLTSALLGFAVFAQSGESRTWLAMIGATLLTVMGDLVFAYAFINPSYTLFVADNGVGAMSYTLFALAFQLHRKQSG